MARTTWTAVVALFLLLALASAPAWGDDPAAEGEAKGSLRISAEVDVSAAGDAKAVIRLAFHPEVFAQLCEPGRQLWRLHRLDNRAHRDLLNLGGPKASPFPCTEVRHGQHDAGSRIDSGTDMLKALTGERCVQ